MPTYEYQCDACEHNFDEFQSITEKPLKKCPKCGKSRLRRVFGTGAAILFKGSGFYQTDYRSESYKAGAKADQEGGKTGTACKDGSTGAIGTSTDKTAPASEKPKGKGSKSASRASDD